MKEILHLGSLIDPTDYLVYIEEAEKLETYIHKYGRKFTFPEHPCWIEYKNEAGVIGSISFTRNTYKHPVLKEMCHKVAEMLTPILSDIQPPNLERIHIIRTHGSIPVHKDEGGRLSCINIGVKNSSTVITRVSNNGVFENFEKNSDEYRILEGHGYLLNTNQWHSVIGDENINRYMITYAFGIPYSSLAMKIKI